MNKTIFFLIFLLGCSNYNNNSSIEKNDFLNKQLVLPKSLIHNNSYKLSYRADTNYNIITYINGNCYVCLQDLEKWQQLLDDFNCSSLFYIHTFDSLALISELEQIQFELPYCIDPSQKFLIMNHLPNNKTFHSFLIDESNVIQALGDPVNNKGCRNDFNKILLQKSGNSVALFQSHLTFYACRNSNYLSNTGMLNLPIRNDRICKYE